MQSDNEICPVHVIPQNKSFVKNFWENVAWKLLSGQVLFNFQGILCKKEFEEFKVLWWFC